jgi:hypothetical protein
MPAYSAGIQVRGNGEQRLASFLVAYAVFKSGLLAADGSAATPGSSPYAYSLSRKLGATYEDIHDDLAALKRELPRFVANQEATSDGQLAGRLRVKSPPAADVQREVANRWLLALTSGKFDQVTDYLEAFPESPFASDAAQWLFARSR